MTACNVFVNVPFVNGGALMAENVYDHASPAVKRAYVEALLGEAEGFAQEAADLDIRSLTLGGGSVSTLPEQELGTLLRGLARVFPLTRETPLYATFDPGLMTVGQANRLRETGRFLPQFRYFCANGAEAALLDMPSGEVEMSKTDQLLEQVGAPGVGMQIALAIPGQTERELEDTLRKAVRGTVERIIFVVPAAGIATDDLGSAAALYERGRRWLADRGFSEDCLLHFSRDGSTDPFDRDFYGAPAGEPATGTLCLGPSTVSCLDGLLWSNSGDVDAYIASRGNAELITAAASALDEETVALRSVLGDLYRGGRVALPQPVRATLPRELFCEGEEGSVALTPAGRLCHRAAFAQLAEAVAASR